jgi:DMSO/TMAO reductase YedYZ heme-binding membrane subunit
MTHGTNCPASGPSLVDTPGRGTRDRSFLRWFSLRWLTTLIVLTNVTYAGLITTQALAGTIRHATADTGIYGSILLLFALVPANLLRFGWFKKRKLVRFFAGLRKSLGISAGVWFVAHTVVRLVEYLNLSESLLRQFLDRGHVTRRGRDARVRSAPRHLH